MPLSTLRATPRDLACKTRGQDGFAALLSCRALSSPTTCRFIPALSERTGSRYLRRRSPAGATRKLWSAFLRNHRDVIAAMDFFTMPTLTFRVLYCFFVIEHSRRKILHFNVTEHPSGSWIAQQLREAFPESCPYRYAIL